MRSSILQNWEKLLGNIHFQFCNPACAVYFKEKNNYEKNRRKVRIWKLNLKK